MDAKVACKQLGYKNGAFAGIPLDAPQLTPALLDNLACTGKESRLVDCASNEPIIKCEDILLGCGQVVSRFSAVSIACSNWTPRAAPASSPTETAPMAS